MSWIPKHTITDKFLMTIREIGKAIGEVKGFSLTGKTLAGLGWTPGNYPVTPQPASRATRFP
jgi:hypothetical protein